MKNKQTIDDWDGDYNKAWSQKTQSFVKMNSSWSKLKFKLFGDLRFIYWIIGLGIILPIIFYGIIAFIGLHFITKFW